jgi:hypothetical protein
VPFKSKWADKPYYRDLGAVVDQELAQAPDFYAGEIETIKARARRLEEIVAKIANLLPQAERDQLADELGYERSNDAKA